MSERIEHAVIAAMTAACMDQDVEVTPSTEVLQLVDSMGMLSAIVDVQDTLGLTLQPQQLVDVFSCRRVGDIVTVLEGAARESRVRESHSLSLASYFAVD